MAPIPPAIRYDRYRAEGGYALLRNVHAASAAGASGGDAGAELSGERIMTVLDDSKLRGLGGAGFPTGRKWRILRDQPAPRLMAVNIDEGEPGTFKDRHFLETDPHRFFEGMLIAAEVVDVAEIYIYLRDEYAGIRALLEQELDALRADPPCPLPPIHLRRGAGAYICGEESAMIESLEGKRGMPRLRPPYVAEVGLFGRPTLEHNMETLYWVRDLLERGPDWFASQGRNGRSGLRAFSVSGRVRKPGVHLAPAGITPARADRRVLRRHARGPYALRLFSRRRLRRHPARLAGGPAAGLRHPATPRLLHRLRGDHRLVPARQRPPGGTECDALLRARVLRSVHPVPGGHRQGGEADAGDDLGSGPCSMISAR